MTYIPDLKEFALTEYNALILQSREPKEDFNEWYEKVFLPAIYNELERS